MLQKPKVGGGVGDARVPRVSLRRTQKGFSTKFEGSRVMAEPPVLPQQREAEPFGKRADQYHPARKSGEKRSVGRAPRGGSALDPYLQVSIVVVRERSHLERVGDRCRSLAIRLSQRNSTHMLGASPLTA